jgi:GT2 family glycosyltransferase
MHVERPEGTVVIQARGANVSENRNGIAERALALGCTHIWYVDDDQVFAPDTLNRLLAHDKDMVSGLYLKREAPFAPQVYDEADARGFCKPRLLREFERGLIPAVATGAGCLLVKTTVLAAMDRPWWTLGQITKDGWGDDLDFCLRAKKAGFSLWCDLDVLVGHQMALTVWPQYDMNTGKWQTTLVGKEPLVSFPAARIKTSVLTV